MWMLLSHLNKEESIRNPKSCTLHRLTYCLQSNYKQIKSLVESAIAQGYVIPDSNSKGYCITDEGRAYEKKIEEVLWPFYEGIIVQFKAARLMTRR